MDPKPSFFKRYSLVLFFLLAYGLSWGNYLLAARQPGFPFLYPFGPLIAALIVASASGGWGGLKELARRCLRWRVGLQWYAAALLVPLGIGLVTVYLSALAGGPALGAVKLDPWYSLFLLFPMALVDAPLGEEPGWRGFALPGFPARRSPLANTLLLALLVVGWHIPLVISEPGLALPYLIAGFASAILTNWIYYNACGSALLAMLYHTSANTIGLYFTPLHSGADGVRYFWMLALVNWVAAAIVVLATGPALQRQPGLSKGLVPVNKPSTACE